MSDTSTIDKHYGPEFARNVLSQIADERDRAWAIIRISNLIEYSESLQRELDKLRARPPRGMIELRANCGGTVWVRPEHITSITSHSAHQSCWTEITVGNKTIKVSGIESEIKRKMENA